MTPPFWFFEFYYYCMYGCMCLCECMMWVAQISWCFGRGQRLQLVKWFFSFHVSIYFGDWLQALRLILLIELEPSCHLELHFFDVYALLGHLPLRQAMLDNVGKNDSQFLLISSPRSIFDVYQSLRNSCLLSMVEFMYNLSWLEAETRASSPRLVKPGIHSKYPSSQSQVAKTRKREKENTRLRLVGLSFILQEY